MTTDQQSATAYAAKYYIGQTEFWNEENILFYSFSQRVDDT